MSKSFEHWLKIVESKKFEALDGELNSFGGVIPPEDKWQSIQSKEYQNVVNTGIPFGDKLFIADDKDFFLQNIGKKIRFKYDSTELYPKILQPKIMASNEIKEDLYFPKNKPTSNYEEELKPFLEEFIEDAFGTGLAGYKLFDGGKTITIYQIGPQELEREMWEYTAIDLVTFLRKNNFDGYEIGHYDNKSCTIKIQGTNEAHNSNYSLKDIPNGEYKGSYLGYEVYIDSIDSGFRTTTGYRNVSPFECTVIIKDGHAIVYSKGGINFSDDETRDKWKQKYKTLQEDPNFKY